jgi:predicted  nucleic acid-binding Zn-ribbon protein
MASELNAESIAKLHEKLDLLITNSIAATSTLTRVSSGRDLQSLQDAKVSLEAETRELKYDMDIILRQNAQLEKEVTRLCDGM